MLAELKSQIKKSLGYSISIGISNFHFKIDELENAYNEALYALDAKFFLGYNSVVFFHDINKNQKNTVSYPYDMEKSIICSANKGDKKALEGSFNAFFKYLKDADLTKDCIVKMHKTLFFSLHHRLSDDKIDADIIIEYIDKLNDYGRFLTINEFKDKMLNFLLIILDNLSSARKDNKNIQKAIQYINENYDKSLDLQAVADNIYLTPCYVSMLFKKKLGINFVSYLQGIRLKKACDLLINTKLKCYEIAYMVGFRDEKYFMQVFKKSFGITPTQYRNS
jgi:two-component system response regulator YesN